MILAIPDVNIFWAERINWSFQNQLQEQISWRGFPNIETFRHFEIEREQMSDHFFAHKVAVYTKKN